MRGRYTIVFTLIVIYLASIAVFLIFFGPGDSKPKHTHTVANIQTTTPTTTSPTSPTSTGTVTASPSITPTVQKTACEADRDNIQTALDAYHNDNGYWPTADGQPGDIVWDELAPQYMSEMPTIDSSCDWQVSGNPEGSVCVSHTC